MLLCPERVFLLLHSFVFVRQLSDADNTVSGLGTITRMLCLLAILQWTRYS